MVFIEKGNYRIFWHWRYQKYLPIEKIVTQIDQRHFANPALAEIRQLWQNQRYSNPLWSKILDSLRIASSQPLWQMWPRKTGKKREKCIKIYVLYHTSLKSKLANLWVPFTKTIPLESSCTGHLKRSHDLAVSSNVTFKKFHLKIGK